MMQTIYDSIAFAVIHQVANTEEVKQALNKSRRAARLVAIPAPRNIFEIIDKRTRKELVLDGEWAGFFQDCIYEWQTNTPTQEEVELVLDSWVQLAQIPIARLH